MAFSIMSARQKEKFKNRLSRSTSPTRCPAWAASAATSSSSAARSAWCCASSRRESCTIRELLLPPVLEKICRGAARPGAVHRHDRLGQVDDAGGDDRLHQHQPQRAHHHHRGPDRVPAPRQEVDRQPARGRGRHARASRVALRAALRQDPDVILVGEMRDYETIETALHGRRDRPPGASRPCTPWTPPRPSTASSRSSRRTSRSRSASSSPRCSRRSSRCACMPRADGLGRVPAVEVLIATALHPRLHREQGEDQATSATRSRPAPRSTACRPSTSRSSSSTSRA